ncbi:g4176 [Coccomyxa viridis]|uniref:G4176 protein n=1 Tax=Coccomyxa viridis TaxID=1274662 RepID=A0ABP1FWR2_9CHLO
MAVHVSCPPSRLPFSSFTKGASGNYSYAGFLIDLLPLLLEQAGIGEELQYSPAIDNARTGAISALRHGTADICAFPFTATYEPEFDQTVSVYNVGLRLLIKGTEEQSAVLVFLAPFSAALWITIACSPFFVAAVLTVIAKLTPLGIYNIVRTRQIDHHTGPHPVEEHAIEAESESFLLEAWMAMVGQALVPRGRSWAVRLVSLAAGLFGVVLLAAYTANLAAILTDTSASTSIKSVQDVLRRDELIALRPSGYTWTFFQTSRDPVIQQLQKNLVPFVENDKGTALLREDKVAAVMDVNPFLTSMADTSPCDLKVVGDPIGATSTVFLLPKGSNLTQPLNRAILELSEKGVLDELEEKWMKPKVCPDDSDLKTGNTAPQLNIMSFRGLYYMLFVFAALSLLWTAVEHVGLAVMSRNKTMREKAENISEFLTSDGSHLFKEGEKGRRALQEPRGVMYMRRTMSKDDSQLEMGDQKAEHGAMHRVMHVGPSDAQRTSDAHVVLSSMPAARYY